MRTEWDFLTKSLFDPAIFWTMATALATVALIIVAYWQLRSLARTSRSDFLLRLKSDFFTEEARRLIFLAENDLLIFHPDAIPYFEVVARSEPEVSRMQELGITTKSISVYVVDDVLFGPMEDLGVLQSFGLVSLKEVYEAFVTYVHICVESKPLKEFLDWSRGDPEDEDVYDHLLELHKRLQAATPRIRETKRWKNRIRDWTR